MPPSSSPSENEIEDADQADRERHLRAEQQAREFVTAERVGAEQVEPAALHAEQMHVGRKQPEDPVVRAADEEAQRPLDGRNLLVGERGGVRETGLPDQGTEVEPAAGVHPVQRLRRVEVALAVHVFLGVRRDERRHQRQQIEDDQQGAEIRMVLFQRIPPRRDSFAIPNAALPSARRSRRDVPADTRPALSPPPARPRPHRARAGRTLSVRTAAPRPRDR